MPNDDRFEDREAEVQRTAREAALRQFPNPNRIGCPDSETIIGIAAKTVSFNHPAMVHVAQCSECLQDIARLEEAAARETSAAPLGRGCCPPDLDWNGNHGGTSCAAFANPAAQWRTEILCRKNRGFRPPAIRPLPRGAKSRHVQYSFNTASGSAHTINVSIARLKTGTIRDPIARRSSALGSVRWRSDSNHRQCPYARHAS